MRAEKSQAVLKTGQNRPQKTPSPEPPFMGGCFFISPAEYRELHSSASLCKRISCIVAQTIVRQLVSKVQDVDLICALAHEAPEAFNGVGRLNMPVHGSRKSREREEMLFVLSQASHRLRRAHRILGGSRRPMGLMPQTLSLAARCPPIRPGPQLVHVWGERQRFSSSTKRTE